MVVLSLPIQLSQTIAGAAIASLPLACAIVGRVVVSLLPTTRRIAATGICCLIRGGTTSCRHNPVVRITSCPSLGHITRSPLPHEARYRAHTHLLSSQCARNAYSLLLPPQSWAPLSNLSRGGVAHRPIRCHYHYITGSPVRSSHCGVASINTSRCRCNVMRSPMCPSRGCVVHTPIHSGFGIVHSPVCLSHCGVACITTRRSRCLQRAQPRLPEKL
jgi:hypothetical protein